MPPMRQRSIAVGRARARSSPAQADGRGADRELPKRCSALNRARELVAELVLARRGDELPDATRSRHCLAHLAAAGNRGTPRAADPE